MAMRSKKKAQIETASIEDFWSWFLSAAEDLAGLLDKNDVEGLAAAMDPRVSRLHRDLAWELGPGKQTHYALTITAAGNRALRPATDRIVTSAPEVRGWEFYPARQPGPLPEEVKLHDREIAVPTRSWKFNPRDDLDSGKVDLIIVDAQLATADKNSAFSALFIALDALLGEDVVEEWIGKISFVPPGSDFPRIYPMQELPHYIQWATTSPEGPLAPVKR